MRKLTLTIAAVATALTAGIASAQSVSPGVAQLAASAGVSPTAYTQSQLIRLIEAQRNNDQQAIDFIMGQAGADVSRSDKGASGSAGDAQLAALAGVEPGRFTTNELVRLIDAQRDNDRQEVDFILSGTNREGEAAGISAGKAQLAAGLRVNPADFTLAELSAMFADKISD